MRVLMISKACLVGAYQRKLEAIAAHDGVELVVVVPPAWRDERGELKLERAHTAGYRLVVEPVAFGGNFHMHFYPRLGRAFARFRPDVVHIDEEPYNLATWHALWLARRAGARALFFTWQNINRRYPFPFDLGERWTLRRVDYAIAGTDGAAAVWRTKGYHGPLAVIPQFGVDPDIFSPGAARPAGAFRVGYAVGWCRRRASICCCAPSPGLRATGGLRCAAAARRRGTSNGWRRRWASRTG
ncbi:MAG: glycosyltransferase [Anaerolineae bacterium]|nr:glycosyltransferase [Anaerolineae bacterium]